MNLNTLIFGYIDESKSIKNLINIILKIKKNNEDPEKFIGELQKIGVVKYETTGWLFPEALNKKRHDRLKEEFIQLYEGRREFFENQRISHEVHVLMEDLKKQNPNMGCIIVGMSKAGIKFTETNELKATSSNPEIRDLQNEIIQKYNQTEKNIAEQRMRIIIKKCAAKTGLPYLENESDDKLSVMKDTTRSDANSQGNPATSELLRRVTHDGKHYAVAVPNTLAGIDKTGKKEI